MNVYELANQYALDVIASDDFQRLLKLKEIINQKIPQKIIKFKNAEANYLDAKKYGDYHPDLGKYQKELVAAKSELFSEPLVKEYKELESKIQSQLDKDLNFLKKSISNKFSLSKKIWKCQEKILDTYFFYGIILLY